MTRAGATASAQSFGSAVVVDDDPDIRETIEWQLAEAGCTVYTANDGDEAVRLLQEKTPDVVIIDLVLPRRGGLDVLRHAVQLESNPVLIVMSGKSNSVDRILALELGADDFVEKPFSTRELLARISACLRRRGDRTISGSSAHTLDFGRIVIDLDRCQVRVAGRDAQLTRREFDLLLFLASNAGRVFSKLELLSQVWGSEPGWVGDATVIEHVRRVRRKIELNSQNPVLIRTVRGHGYVFEAVS